MQYNLIKTALFGLCVWPLAASGVVTFTTVPEVFTYQAGSAAGTAFAANSYPDLPHISDDYPQEYAVRFTPTVTGELSSIETAFGYFSGNVTRPDDLSVSLRIVPAVATAERPQAASIPQLDWVMTSWTIESEDIFARLPGSEFNLVTSPVLTLTAEPGVILEAGLDYWLWIAPGNSISQSVFWPLNPDDSDILILPRYEIAANGDPITGMGAAPAFRVNVSPVPEPAFYAALLAAGALVFTFLRRRA